LVLFLAPCGMAPRWEIMIQPGVLAGSNKLICTKYMILLLFVINEL
jgi:hypothetical protein